MNPALPPNWATLVQPPPRNHGTPAIDALRPGQPLRELVGDMLADAAIERAEKIGLPTYGSLLTADNGRNQPVEILQELADTPGALVAWLQEIGEDNSLHATMERQWVTSAMGQLDNIAWSLNAAARYRAKRLAKAKGQGRDAMTEKEFVLSVYPGAWSIIWDSGPNDEDRWAIRSSSSDDGKNISSENPWPETEATAWASAARRIREQQANGKEHGNG